MYYNDGYQVDNDIGLLKLETPITYNDYIRPVCLPQHGVNLAVVNSIQYITGWGLNEWGQLSDVLKQAKLTTLSNDVCGGAIDDNKICFSQTSPLISACYGDSGTILKII